MAILQPFAGVRYDLDKVDLADVVAPSSDVIDAAMRVRLEARSPYNAVRVVLPDDDADGDGGDRGNEVEGRYEAVHRRFDGWLTQGILRRDPEPGYYVYRMGWHDDEGRPHQTTGVLGALELSTPDLGQVLPHERTMGAAKDDRLSLLRATRANLSGVWTLSLATGLSDLLDVPHPPLARCTDDDGVHHRLWRITQPAALSAITEAIGSAPVVIADGHHRYETALAYRDERAAAAGGGRGDYDLVMALVVEMDDAQVQVRPIHRLLRGLPDGFDVGGALASFFHVIDVGSPDGGRLTERMAGDGALGLVLADRSWLLVPRDSTTDDPDAARLEAALASLPSHDLAFHHSPETVTELVRSGDAQAGVLLRPFAMAQIAEAARAGRRMPEKTTFFAPKPRTGLVFRRLGD